MRGIMSEGNNRTPATGKKRGRKLKRLIILLLIIIPYVCCALLLVEVYNQNQMLQDATFRLEEMNRLFREQQILLQESRRQTDESMPADLADIALEEETEQQSEEQEATDVTEIQAAHKVYLTFDDGPSIYTDDILDILDQYDVKATFFVVGKEDKASQEALQEIVDRGHSLGMHSYSHKYKELYASVDGFAEDFRKLQDYLFDVTGVRSTIYRFPGGSSNTVSSLDMQEFAGYLEEQNVTFYDWNASSGDGGSRLLSVEELVNNSTQNIENRNTTIILMHDSADKRTTVEALPVIIENILALEDTVILPITENTKPVQHIQTKVKE